jgi:tetratricopeptide (TPR) repeat protein
VHRKANRFDAADAAYEAAHGLALSASDRHAALLSKIGRANTTYGRGNLPEAERLYRELRWEAADTGFPDAEAGAEHGLAVTLLAQGQCAEAIPHAWRAFERCEDHVSQLRALNDLGIMWLALGDVDNAERALAEVVRRGGSQDNVSNSLIELMNCASYRRDRVGFERWRTRCESRLDQMPPNILTDFHLKAGIGVVRFGQLTKGEDLLRRALALASDAGLHEFEFRIQRILSGLRDCETTVDDGGHAIAAPAPESAALRKVSDSLAHLEA